MSWDPRYDSETVPLWIGGKCARCGVDTSEQGRMCMSCRLTRKIPDLDTTWTDDALCAQTDPDLFFPEKGGTSNDARAVCQQCPVIAECLTYALDARMSDGVWGGMSAAERKAILRKRAPRAGAA